MSLRRSRCLSRTLGSGILLGVECRLASAVFAHNLSYGLAAGWLLRNGHPQGLAESALLHCSAGNENTLFEGAVEVLRVSVAGTGR